MEQRASPPSPTYREISPGLEDRLFIPTAVLDHGFVRVVDYMGNDSSVVQAARVSYGRGTKHVSEDRGLINYLLRHRHTTPFEMAEIKLHVKLPIFVARQWIRHRTASVNEYSARYSVLDKEFYVPAAEHLASQSTSNRQGRGQILTGDEAQRALAILKETANQTYEEYLILLNMNHDGTTRVEGNDGLARELARANLTIGFYTQWYWKVNLHNLMGFLLLRADPHAQYEIRAYADVILDLMSRWVPLTYEAFLEHRLHSATFSSTGVRVIKRMLAGEVVTEASSGLSSREWAELSEILR
ncbi:FAD-dependent thymidylate synthase [Hoeflea sp. BAL378]|uniref:FAD-dependent thymidylate synthase n=1 Tax=Hoeflea sp. BAL378 TaxID=1547437 RepID=UPI000512DF7D|nr:FAD-dependent thymidylate synthase [Hoeflea sp. BAL378]KGF67815.1 FAD-dependent thymidylate synthase [Hoeflea sp. BAL378]